MSSPDKVVRFEVADQVATVTLDSPHNRNALSRRLVGELTDHVVAADGREDVRVVHLTHTGGTFCAGADLTEAVEVGMEQGTRDLLALLRTVVTLQKPVVATVRGHVRAGGLGLMGACDVALVSEESTFAFTESLLGLAPAVISLTTRSRLSERDAAYKYLTGTAFSGVEAVRSGLATAAVPADALSALVSELLHQLRQVSPQGLRETKRLLNAPLIAQMDTEGEHLVALSARLFGSLEARKAMQAFRDRRRRSPD